MSCCTDQKPKRMTMNMDGNRNFGVLNRKKYSMKAVRRAVRATMQRLKERQPTAQPGELP